jgi:N-acetylhexosamine 1-kinase
MDTSDRAVAGAVRAFWLGDISAVEPLAGGHIHGTWLATDVHGQHFVAQRINRSVFTDLDACKHNIERIVRGVAPAVGLAVPDHLRTSDGRLHHIDAQGAAWRVARFAEGTHSIERVTDEGVARASAALFGSYDRVLATANVGPFRATISQFHDLGYRRAQLETAIAHDLVGRVASCAGEIAKARASLVLLRGELDALGRLPLRPTHGDAKIGNLRFDDRTGQPVMVLDLDTTMAAPVLVDLGELLRTGTVDGPEDSRSVDDRADERRVEAVVDGFLDGLGDSLVPVERESLPLAGTRMALFNAVRFLADHLAGDIYYAIAHPRQNIERARRQLWISDELRRVGGIVAERANRRA